jgi:hypothetical protein
LLKKQRPSSHIGQEAVLDPGVHLTHFRRPSVAFSTPIINLLLHY